MNNRKLPDLYSDLRNKKGLSQTELANKLNCNKQLISKLESGDRSLSLNMLKAYADFFNVSTDYLLGLQREPTDVPEVIVVTEYTGLSKKATDNLHKYKTYVDSEYMHHETDENGEHRLVTSNEGILYYEALKIINELIGNGDMLNLAKRLYELKYDSQEYFEEIEIRKNVHQTLYGKSDKRSEAEKKGELVHSKKEIDQMRERIDLDRYRLSEFIVHLSDRYDQREQVKNNGNNNPTNK